MRCPTRTARPGVSGHEPGRRRVGAARIRGQAAHRGAPCPTVVHREHEDRIGRGREPEAIEEKEYRPDRRRGLARDGGGHDYQGAATEGAFSLFDARAYLVEALRLEK